jgi:hypothetical protein
MSRLSEQNEYLVSANTKFNISMYRYIEHAASARDRCFEFLLSLRVFPSFYVLSGNGGDRAMS